jgi:hypothetical protein
MTAEIKLGKRPQSLETGGLPQGGEEPPEEGLPFPLP